MVAASDDECVPILCLQKCNNTTNRSTIRQQFSSLLSSIIIHHQQLTYVLSNKVNAKHLCRSCVDDDIVLFYHHHYHLLLAGLPSSLVLLLLFYIVVPQIPIPLKKLGFFYCQVVIIIGDRKICAKSINAAQQFML